MLFVNQGKGEQQLFKSFGLIRQENRSRPSDYEADAQANYFPSELAFRQQKIFPI